MITLTLPDGTKIEDTCGACGDCQFCTTWDDALNYVRTNYSRSLKEGLDKHDPSTVQDDTRLPSLRDEPS